MSSKLMSLSPKLSQSKKDLVSCCMCLMLVILASQSHAFDFMIYSDLGRILTIAFVMMLCYLNKTFGFASLIFIGLALTIQYSQREGLEGGKVPDCKSYLLECEACKKMGNGSFCEMHSELCHTGTADVNGKESMCPMKRKQQAKEGMINLIDKERKMQLGMSSTTSANPPMESVFNDNVIAFDGRKEQSNSFP